MQRRTRRTWKRRGGGSTSSSRPQPKNSAPIRIRKRKAALRRQKEKRGQPELASRILETTALGGVVFRKGQMRTASVRSEDGAGETGSSTISAKPGIDFSGPSATARGRSQFFPGVLLLAVPGEPNTCYKVLPQQKHIFFCVIVVVPFWKHEVFRFSNLQEIPRTFLLFAVGVVLISTGDFLGAESRWL